VCNEEVRVGCVFAAVADCDRMDLLGLGEVGVPLVVAAVDVAVWE